MTVRSLLAAFSVLAAFATTSSGDDFPAPYDTEKSPTAPMAPAAVVKTVKLPPGFQLSVFAAEPDVQNPIAITTDERGRLWVVENYTWAGGNFGHWDSKLKDRIVILEDTDGNGRHDRRTVFWEQGRKATSVEVGFGGVWVLDLPQLLFIPDKNRDDVPDGPPVVVLDGLDEHAVGHTPANGLKWGPDGWLYARHGIQGTSSIGRPGASDSQRVKINTGIWRYHPVRGTVEAVMHGMTNSWGFDYDQHGEMFVINTVIGHLWHVVPGAHVERMYGTDLNPRTYGLIPQVADHVHWDTGEVWHDVRKGVTDKTSAAGGGHAHIGLMIYQGDNWPAAYRGKAYTLNLHGRRINCDILERSGASYTARHGDDMCFVADPWYRAMDLIAAPDGGVYISDWSDTGECHDVDGVHRNSGRIYKLTYAAPGKVEPFDIARYENQRLVELQQHPNAWWARQARRVVQERAAALVEKHNDDPDGSPSTDAELSALQRVIHSASKRSATRYAGCDCCGRLTPRSRHPLSIFSRPLPLRRTSTSAVWQLRFALDQFPIGGELVPQKLADTLASVAQDETSGLVQLYLASALQRLPLDRRWAIAEALCSHCEFAGDRELPLMIWYGIEPAVAHDRARSLELIAASQIPLIRQYVARRLTEDIEADLDTVNALVELAERADPPVAQDILVGMARALRGWSKAPQPAAWSSAASRFASSDSAELKQNVQELGVVFGDGRATDELRAIVVDAGADPGARRQALRSLLVGKPADLVAALQNLAGDRVMALEAIRGLAFYDHPDTPQCISRSWGIYGPAERSEAINTLCPGPPMPRHCSTCCARAHRQERRHGVSRPADQQFRRSGAESSIGGAVGRSPRVHRREAFVNRAIQVTTNARRAGPGAPRRGPRTVSKELCKLPRIVRRGPQSRARSHGIESQKPGLPARKRDRPQRQRWIGFPNMGFGPRRRPRAQRRDHRTERAHLDAANRQEPITLDRRTIDQMQHTRNSLMPDGVLQQLSDQQVRDLLSYLMSPGQVPLPD